MSSGYINLVLASIVIYFLVLHLDTQQSNVNGQILRRKNGQPLFYRFRQVNKTFYKVINDPEQVKPKIVTQDNLFDFLNSKNVVKFRLWTRRNPHLAHEIRYNDVETFRTSNFDPGRVTKMIIHGYLDGASEVRIGDWIIFMRNNFLKLADVNFMVVDYAVQSLTSPYLSGRTNTVGKRVAEMIMFLEAQNVSISTFHLIGWSWGAQIAGFAGRELNGRLPRITGLDPAGPAFRFVENEHRLDKSDARFVDVFHTNSGNRTFWGGHLGLYEPLAHVDVYFNGGERQAGCPRQRTLSFGSLWCNHGRAPAYYIESVISPLAFPTCECDTLDSYINGDCNCTKEKIQYMGEHTPITTRGIFHIITRSNPPFGLGPKMKISQTDNRKGENLEKEELMKYVNATIEIGNKSYTAQNIIDSYKSEFWPNNQILNLAKDVYKMEENEL